MCFRQPVQPSSPAASWLLQRWLPSIFSTALSIFLAMVFQACVSSLVCSSFFRMRQSIFNKKSIASHGTRISLTHSDVECHKILLKEYTQVLHCSLLWLLLHTRSVPDQYMKTQYKQMPVPLSLQPQMVHSIM